jgi:hypothetical protein
MDSFCIDSSILDIGSRRAEARAKRMRGFEAELRSNPTHFDVPNVPDVRIEYRRAPSGYVVIRRSLCFFLLLSWSWLDLMAGPKGFICTFIINIWIDLDSFLTSLSFVACFVLPLTLPTPLFYLSLHAACRVLSQQLRLGVRPVRCKPGAEILQGYDHVGVQVRRRHHCQR